MVGQPANYTILQFDIKCYFTFSTLFNTGDNSTEDVLDLLNSLVMLLY